MLKLSAFLVALTFTTCLGAPTVSPSAATVRSSDSLVDCKGKDTLKVDPKDKHKFHVCYGGQDVGTQQCMSTLVFDEQKQACNFESGSKDRQHDKDQKCPSQSGLFKYPGDPHKFIECNAGFAYVLTCPGNLIFDETSHSCVFNINRVTAQTPAPTPPTPPTTPVCHTQVGTRPTSAPTVRPIDSSVDCKGKDTLKVDPKDKHKFHVCLNGKDIAIERCPGALVFDSNTQACNFDAGSKDGQHDKDHKCPSENGLFKYPGDPRKFIECSGGFAYVLACPGALVFDEDSKVCVFNTKGVTWQTQGTSKPVTSAPVQTTSKPVSTTVAVKTQAPVGTTAKVECVIKGFFPDPADKHKFHVCKNGKIQTLSCPDGTNFDDSANTCA